MNAKNHNNANQSNLLENFISNLRMPEVKPVPQDFYDLMTSHDNNTLYVISDSNEPISYLGDIRVYDYKNKYFIGQNINGYYVIYKNEYICKSSELIPICIYDNPQAAIDDLSRFNRVGSHVKRDFDIYNIIKSYINRDISTHDFIIAILTIFNFTESSGLYSIIEVAVTYCETNSKLEFSSSYLEIIGKINSSYPNTIFTIYSKLYDLLIKYNFFKDKKYRVDNVNLSLEIENIFNIIMNQI